jgi:DNA-directed RNA polymerase specialized sigma24 family protein
VTYALDVLVRRVQRGDEQALELLVGALRGPLLRHVRRLGCAPVDCEDVVQEALIDVVRGIAGYRWQASFLSWAYAIASRRAARHARRSTAATLPLLEALEQSIRLPEDPLAPAEAILVEQDAHLACAFVVAQQLSGGLRRAYLLGEALGVTDAVGAEVCKISRVAFRQRVSRARREVERAIRDALDGTGSALTPGDVDATAPVELDRLVRLGELHRTSRRNADACAVLRAARLAAPGLLADARPVRAGSGRGFTPANPRPPTMSRGT